VRFHELARETGVRVQSTAPDGGARAAGMLSGDIVVAVDGIAVGDVDELHRLMTEERVGKPVPIAVLRRPRSSMFSSNWWLRLRRQGVEVSARSKALRIEVLHASPLIGNKISRPPVV
jgi:C-terminal processing protease CtpA/Prc